MTIQTQLFEGKLIRLTPIDHEKDAELQARWTNDPDFLHALGGEPARPVSPAQMKKKFEAIEKQVEESKNTFYFTIRSLEDSRLLGFVRLEWIEWTHNTGHLTMAIGDPQERGKGYGGEALRLVLRFAFDELNLYRLSAILEDNPAGLRSSSGTGFQEVRHSAGAVKVDAIRPGRWRRAPMTRRWSHDHNIFTGRLVHLAADRRR
jgi:RimJ/RimL family protein N-acetyltransferase